MEPKGSKRRAKGTNNELKDIPGATLGTLQKPVSVRCLLLFFEGKGGSEETKGTQKSSKSHPVRPTRTKREPREAKRAPREPPETPKSVQDTKKEKIMNPPGSVPGESECPLSCTSPSLLLLNQRPALHQRFPSSASLESGPAEAPPPPRTPPSSQ